MSSESSDSATIAAQAAKARAFRDAHLHGFLVLPCAWDAVSARLFCGMEGCRAVGTTSAGIAAAHGLADGQRLRADEMLAAVEQVCSAVDLPVSADLESGYADEPAQVGAFVAAALQRGAVGANLEDGLPTPDRVLRPAAVHAASISAARDAAEAAGLANAVINARTDVFWLEVGARSSRLEQAVDRLRAYEQAGADCLFVPGFPEATLTADEAERQLARLLGAVSTPVNLLIDPRMPLSLRRLAELGVRRVSTGSALYRVALASARDSARRVLHDSDLAALRPAANLGYQELLATLSGTVPAR